MVNPESVNREVEQGEVEPTQADFAASLRTRFEAGEDVSEEARKLLFELKAHQAYRTQYEVEISDEDFQKEEAFAEGLKAIIVS